MLLLPLHPVYWGHVWEVIIIILFAELPSIAGSCHGPLSVHSFYSRQDGACAQV